MKIKKYTLICFFIFLLVIGCMKKEEADSYDKIVSSADEEISEPVSEKALMAAEVNLTASKIMVPERLTIKKGTAVRWNNQDKNFYHNLIIYSAEIERPKSDDIIIQSGNIAPLKWWDYVFEESGNYAVKDIYSGTMKGEITAEAAADISETKIIGRIAVE